MGWAIGYDYDWKRDIGYGVPAYCDHPGCGAEIDRGLAFVCCGQELYGGNDGCGLFFCSQHSNIDGMCKRCRCDDEPFEPTLDHPDWIRHKLTDESWLAWRKENPQEVEKIITLLQLKALGMRIYPEKTAAPTVDWNMQTLTYEQRERVRKAWGGFGGWKRLWGKIWPK